MAIEQLIGVGFAGTNLRDEQYASLTNASWYVWLVFAAMANGQITDFGLRYGANAGTRSAKAELFAVGSDLLPSGSALATCSSYTPASYGYTIATFDSAYTVSSGTLYGIKITNIASTPASNYFAPNYGGPRNNGITSVYGSSFLAPAYGASLACKIGGNWYGSKVADGSTSSNLTGYPVYSNSGLSVFNRLGTIVQFPSSIRPYIVACFAYKVGSPTFSAKCTIYKGTSLVATSSNMVNASALTATSTAESMMPFLFNGVTLSASAEYRIVIEPDGYGGDNSNYIVVKNQGGVSSTAWPSNSNTTDYVLGGCYSTVDNSTPSWTDYTSSSTVVLPKFNMRGSTVVASGGGLLVNPGFNGGLVQI